jgi:hypothetical protein
MIKIKGSIAVGGWPVSLFWCQAPSGVHDQMLVPPDSYENLHVWRPPSLICHSSKMSVARMYRTFAVYMVQQILSIYKTSVSSDKVQQ